MNAACGHSRIDKSKKTTQNTYGYIFEYENLLKQMNEAE